MSKTYLRSVAIVTEGERATLDELMVETRPHEAVNASFLGVSPAEQKRMVRELSAESLPKVTRNA